MSVSDEIRIHIFHTGRVCVSPALPFKDKEKNPHPVQLTLLSAYGRRKRVWLPVSAYLIVSIRRGVFWWIRAGIGK